MRCGERVEHHLAPRRIKAIADSLILFPSPQDEEFGDVYTDLPPVSVNSQIEPLEPSEGPVLAEVLGM